MSDKCPKCGAPETWRHSLAISYECDSQRLEGTFSQTETCRIGELEAAVAERDARIAELEAVVVPLENIAINDCVLIEMSGSDWVVRVNEEMRGFGNTLAEALAAAVKAMEVSDGS